MDRLRAKASHLPGGFGTILLFMLQRGWRFP